MNEPRHDLSKLIDDAYIAKRAYDEEFAAHGAFTVGPDSKSNHTRWIEAAIAIASALVDLRERAATPETGESERRRESAEGP
jgi:hypothetical protein